MVILRLSGEWATSLRQVVLALGRYHHHLLHAEASPPSLSPSRRCLNLSDWDKIQPVFKGQESYKFYGLGPRSCTISQWVPSLMYCLISPFDYQEMHNVRFRNTPNSGSATQNTSSFPSQDIGQGQGAFTHLILFLSWHLWYQMMRSFRLNTQNLKYSTFLSCNNFTLSKV